MDRTGHTTVAEWEAADTASVDAAVEAFRRELDRGYRTRMYDAVRVARVLVWCDALALPGAQLSARELLDAIRSDQRDDGSWGSVERTLGAMVALGRLS